MHVWFILHKKINVSYFLVSLSHANLDSQQLLQHEASLQKGTSEVEQLNHNVFVALLFRKLIMHAKPQKRTATKRK